MSKTFENRKEKLDYLDYVIEREKEKNEISGLTLVVSLSALVGSIIMLFDMIENYQFALLLQKGTIGIISALISFSIIILNLLNKSFKKNHFIKDDIFFKGISVLFLGAILFGGFSILQKHYPSLHNTDAALCIFVVYIFVTLGENKYRETIFSKIRFYFFLIIAIIFSIYCLINVRFITTSIEDIFIPIRFSLISYTIIVIIYILLVTLFNKTIINKLELLKHQYLRGDIKFKKILVYIDEFVYIPVKPEKKEKEEGKKNAKLQLPKKRK